MNLRISMETITNDIRCRFHDVDGRSGSGLLSANSTCDTFGSNGGATPRNSV
jgi:hypothetical protein